ncbi:MAG: polysaccharide biosynthesis protein [Firmicutes bacterium]|nr:polysaccharide biosynthesis protein [Bacillota bacterium]MBQ6686158.1 polysaccharide biosynthesis protein [Bacillota bacterium]
MRFEFVVTNHQFVNYLDVFISASLGLLIVKMVTYWLGGLYNSLWKYAGSEELVKVTMVTGVANALAITFLQFTQQYLPRGVNAMVVIIDIILIGGVRMLYRMMREHLYPGNFNVVSGRKARSMKKTMKDTVMGEADEKIRVMIVGAGDAGASMIKEMRLHPENRKKVVVAIDDNKSKQGSRILGVKIAGGRQDIRRIAKKYDIDEIIIAIPTASQTQIREIAEECSKTKCKVQILPGLIDLINEKVTVKKLRDIDIEDLLGREPVKVNLRAISGYLEGRIVMVTGAGGSIGSELCRQIMRFKPRRLVALDIYENSIFELANEIKAKFPDVEFDIVIGSVRDYDRMEEVFRKYKPHVVFHAAAHKHVPLMESNPREAIVNNIQGTKNLLDLSEEHAVSKFVLISTDKAVNPTNVMGATKRVAEMLLQEKSQNSRTNYAAVRFGNVLGSNGSVIPIFREQISHGGPVTVTHEEITRYFMTIPEAVQLVIQAGAMAEGGEIFVLDMGNPVKIMDLAEKLIRLSGFEPYEDIDIKVTGLRPGEKLYEELLLDEEGIATTTHDKIFVDHPVDPSPALSRLLEERCGLQDSIRDILGRSDEEAKAWLRELVPNYGPEMKKH